MKLWRVLSMSCILPKATLAFNPATRKNPPQTTGLGYLNYRGSEHVPWTATSLDDYEMKQMYAPPTTVADEACFSHVCEDIEGVVPHDLAGTLFQAGPGKFERGGKRYGHIMDGDGIVTSFRFQNGKVHYSGRFVETEYFTEEERKQSILYRGAFGTHRDGGPLKNAFDANFKNTANTNVINWGGRTFALWEGGRPYELDPTSLATMPQTVDGPFQDLGSPASRKRCVTIDEGGPIDKAFGLGKAFTAHPHAVDDDTLVAFKTTKNPLLNYFKLDFVEYDSEWQEKKNTSYRIPEGNFVHDFSISTDYYCFFQNSLQFDNLRVVLGQKTPFEAMELIKEKPATLHLVPRTEGKTRAMKFEVPAYFSIHNVPRIEDKEDGKITVYTDGWDLRNEKFFTAEAKQIPMKELFDFHKFLPPSTLYRTVIDVKSEELVSHEPVVPIPLAMPTQDDKFINTVYCAAYRGSESDGLCKLNLRSEKAECWWAESNKLQVGEPIPVKKRNGETGSWVLMVLDDVEKSRATVAVFDSEHIEEGPVCKIHLSHRLGFRVHGSFLPA